MKIKIQLILTSFLFVAITSCADVEQIKPCLDGHTYGFWGGLWHGIIAPFSFIGYLFTDDIGVWAMNNNGGWYTFGFMLGIGAFTGSATSAAKH